MCVFQLGQGTTALFLTKLCLPVSVHAIVSASHLGFQKQVILYQHSRGTSGNSVATGLVHDILIPVIVKSSNTEEKVDNKLSTSKTTQILYLEGRTFKLRSNTKYKNNK